MRITVIASLEGKIVSKYCNISKSLGGSIHPPCTTVGVWICMYVRGLITRTVLSENNKKILPPIKKAVNFALHCIEHYDHCCSLISASRTHCSYEKTSIWERELPSLPSIFSLFFFSFFFLSKEKADTFTQANIARLCCDETNSWASQTVYMRKDWPG